MKGDDETFRYAEEQALSLLKELATAAARKKFQQGSSIPSSSLCAVLKALGATTLRLTTLSIPWKKWLEELLGILLDDAAAHGMTIQIHFANPTGEPMMESFAVVRDVLRIRKKQAPAALQLVWHNVATQSTADGKVSHNLKQPMVIYNEHGWWNESEVLRV
jgi:hypothetical protein